MQRNARIFERKTEEKLETCQKCLDMWLIKDK